MENKGIKHIFVVNFFLLSLLMLVMPMRSSAINKQGFLPNYSSLDDMRGTVFDDIQKIRFEYLGKVEKNKEKVVAKIMLGDEVVLETDSVRIKGLWWGEYGEMTNVYVYLDAKTRLSEGHVYKPEFGIRLCHKVYYATRHDTSSLHMGEWLSMTYKK